MIKKYIVTFIAVLLIFAPAVHLQLSRIILLMTEQVYITKNRGKKHRMIIHMKTPAMERTTRTMVPRTTGQ